MTDPQRRPPPRLFGANNFIAHESMLSDPQQGQIGFDVERQILEWYDGTKTEWPTYCDNDDVTTSPTTVTNTTAEEEIIRSGVNSGALTMGRVFILRLFGRYDTAASEDNFTIRTYIGEPGFNPSNGEGQQLSSVSTTQKNVADAPFREKATVVVTTEGSSGEVRAYSEGVFNNEPLDDGAGALTGVDTTTGEEFVTTVQWNNAKTGNSLTLDTGYLQQQA